MINPSLLTGGDLAFIGDAYLELYVRNHIINLGITSLKKLHNESVKFVSRTSQHKLITTILPTLSEEEVMIFKRGRNYHYKTRTEEYVNASGLEALLGYLYLTKNENRLEELMKQMIEMVEKDNE